LLGQFNQLSRNDLDKIDKLIPDTVDNVQLLIEVNAIAERYGMVIRNITIEDETVGVREVGEVTDETRSARNALSGAGSMEVGSLLVGFSVDGSYRALQLFLGDLARNLRLVDIESLDFISGDEDLFQYDIVLRTYWLK